jgi:DDE_Tnp_1-associated/Transposase DDE domain
MERLSLIEALASVPDPRDPRGVRHPLTAVLSLTVVALLAGCKSLEAIAQFGRDHGVALTHALGFTRGDSPTKSALSKLFRRLDIAAFEAALKRWILSRQQDGWQAVAVDGKTLRGSAAGDAPGVHLLAAYVPSAAAVIAQMRVDAKTNEHKAALKLLGVLPIKGKVVTFDAMFTHRDVAEEVLRQGGDYLFIVKDNQPDLKEQIRAAFDDESAFSPLPTEGQGRRAAVVPHGGQGARAAGDTAADEYDDAQRLPGLAGRGSGVRVGAGA